MVHKPVNVRTFLENIEYRIISTREELEQAYYLVYKEYLKRGYLKENFIQMHFSIFNSLPQVTTFGAVAGSKDIIATATVIPDSPLGLPMDELYNEELNALRKEKKKICEISMLASNTELFQNGISMMLNAKKMFFIFFLFKRIFDYVKEYLHLDFICITINPKHRLTYEFLLFRDLGVLKTYAKVNGAPALGKYLNLNTAEEECKKRGKQGIYKMFFAQKSNHSAYSQKMIFTPEDLRYFFVEKTDIFKNAPPEHLEYIKACYPDYDFSEILKF